MACYWRSNQNLGSSRGLATIEYEVEGVLMNVALGWNMFTGALEGVRCKARGSVGPETYVARYFEDHARLRTQQMAH